jgi:hypothetical protein
VSCVFAAGFVSSRWAFSRACMISSGSCVTACCSRVIAVVSIVCSKVIYRNSFFGFEGRYCVWVGVYRFFVVCDMRIDYSTKRE